MLHIFENNYRKIVQQMSEMYSETNYNYLNSLTRRIKEVHPNFDLPYLLLDSFGNYQITSNRDESITTVRGNIINLEHEQNMRLDKLILNISKGKAPAYNGNVANIIELFSYELFPVTMNEVKNTCNIIEIKIR